MKFRFVFIMLAAALCVSCGGKDSQADAKKAKNKYPVPKVGEMTDSRDGKKYKTVKIGNQVWMAENLVFEYKVNGRRYGNVCNKDECKKYGRYYSWAAAMDSAGIYSRDGEGCGNGIGKCPQVIPTRGICPENWHLPDTTEWITLAKNMGGAGTRSIYMLSEDPTHALMATGYGKGCHPMLEKNWKEATNYSGFSAIPAGYSFDGGFYQVCEHHQAGLSAYFWSSRISSFSWGEHAYAFVVDGSSAGIFSDSRRVRMFSVRCIKDEKPRIVDKAEAEYFKAKAEAHTKRPTMEGSEDSQEAEDEEIYYENETDEGEEYEMESDEDSKADSPAEKMNDESNELLSAQMLEKLSTVELLEEDLKSYSKDELRLLRNAVFAKHGYIFKNDDLKNYFGQFSWYAPEYSDIMDQLTPVEKKNIALLKSLEK